jgi:hypothetical protein
MNNHRRVFFVSILSQMRSNGCAKPAKRLRRLARYTATNTTTATTTNAPSTASTMISLTSIRFRTGRHGDSGAVDSRRATSRHRLIACRVRVSRVRSSTAVLRAAAAGTRRGVSGRVCRRRARVGAGGRWRRRRRGRRRGSGGRRRRTRTDLGTTPEKVVLKVVQNLVRKLGRGVRVGAIANQMHNRLCIDAKSRSPAANVHSERCHAAKELAFDVHARRFAAGDACCAVVPYLTNLRFVRIAACRDVHWKLKWTVR